MKSVAACWCLLVASSAGVANEVPFFDASAKIEVPPLGLRAVAAAVSSMAADASARAPTREDNLQITVATYANADPSQPNNRVFVVGNVVFRTFPELKSYVGKFGPNRLVRAHFYAVGSCITREHNLLPVEVEELRAVCEKAGIPFTYTGGG